MKDLHVLVISMSPDRRADLLASIEAMKSQPAVLVPLSLATRPGDVEPLRSAPARRGAPMSPGLDGNSRILRGARAC